MIDLTATREALSSRRPRVLVVGDVMLDHYLDGHSTRLSPEAPVPVLRLTDDEVRLGGAANVAAGLATLGVDVHLVGAIGHDGEGETVRRLLAELATCRSTLVEDPTRPTTTKTRVRDEGRHLVRVDRESTEPLPASAAAEVAAAIDDAATRATVVIVSDYAKGVVTSDVLSSVLGAGLPVLVDPKRPEIERYRGAAVVAPNRLEAQQAWRGEAATVPDEPRALAAHLASRLDGTTVVVTCGADGIVWSDGVDEGHEPARARSVADVTGSGDSVMVGLGVGLLAGRPVAEAVGLASVVAAAAVESPGTAAPTWADLEAHA